jgi:hypothetical protein
MSFEPRISLSVSKAALSISLAAVGASLCSGAAARPSADDNPAYHQYFEGLRTKAGTPCCSDADCKTVRIEMRDGAPWVFIDKKTFGPNSSAPDDWVKVPAEAYGPQSQTGDGSQPERPPEAVACWYDNSDYEDDDGNYSPSGYIRCFDWPLPQARNHYLINYSIG